MRASATLTPTTEQPPPSVVVAEVFGPTFQGEGPSLGVRAAFVRLGGCNLSCSWCDTPYTWDASRYDLRHELTRTPVTDIVAQVRAMRPRIVVVTGGEPLLQQNRPGWGPLITGLHDVGDVEVETNGTIAPERYRRVGRYNVSPKLAHSGDPEDRRINPKALAVFGRLSHLGRACLKIVVRTVDDIAEAAKLADTHGFDPTAVFVMPEGTDAQTLLRRHAELAPAALEHGVNMTTRLHILTWGDERGT